jgi:hypothetical protein
MAPFIDKNFLSLNELTDRMGMTMEKNKRISFDVIKILLPDIMEHWDAQS